MAYQIRRTVERRVDQSMDLLNNISRDAVDPSYATAVRAGARPSRRPGWASGLALLLVGLMLSIAIVETTKAAPVAQIERDQLIARIKAAEKEQDALRQKANALAAQNRDLQAQAAGLSPQLQQLINQLDVATGMRAVTGPGVVIVADDGVDPDVKGSRIVDADLREAVNSLWQAGAEAIAINGHRLSARTAIRGAGDAITVDYRSLTHPFRIEAIGDSSSLQSRFAASSGGAWWKYLREKYGIRYELSSARRLDLAADPGLAVNQAVPVEP